MKSGRGGSGRHQSDDADQVEGENPEEGQGLRSCVGRRHESYHSTENTTRPLFIKDKRVPSRGGTR